MNTKGMQRVGRGAFSTVYRKSHKTVLIKSRDSVKECMALGWFPSCTMFPTLKRVGQAQEEGFSLYEERYYPYQKSLKNSLTPFEHEFYTELRKAFKKKVRPPWAKHYEWWSRVFKSLPNKFWYKKKMLQEALDALADYGDDMCFEISPRNVTAHRGKLVLLDCFFMESQL